MEVVLPPPSRHGRASGMGFTIVGRGPASLDARVCSCMTSAVPEISRRMEQCCRGRTWQLHSACRDNNTVSVASVRAVSAVAVRFSYSKLRP